MIEVICNDRLGKKVSAGVSTMPHSVGFCRVCVT